MLALQSCDSMLKHSDLKFVQTQAFRVLENKGVDTHSRSIGAYTIIDNTDKEKNKKYLKNMRLYGYVTWRGLVSEQALLKARKVVLPFAKKLIAAYDELEDEFSCIDQDEMDIVRMPRIGRGKHNIHFDPLMSAQHAAVAELAQESHLAEVLSKYMGARCELRESGLSITRPYNADFVSKPNQCQVEKQYYSRDKAKVNTSDEQNNSTESAESKISCEDTNQNSNQSEVEVEEEEDQRAGEGMEWHSDGPRGEATVLLALDDVDHEQGSLRIVPGSHNVYVDGVGHTEVSWFWASEIIHIVFVF